MATPLAPAGGVEPRAQPNSQDLSRGGQTKINDAFLAQIMVKLREVAEASAANVALLKATSTSASRPASRNSSQSGCKTPKEDLSRPSSRKNTLYTPQEDTNKQTAQDGFKLPLNPEPNSLTQESKEKRTRALSEVNNTIDTASSVLLKQASEGRPMHQQFFNKWLVSMSEEVGGRRVMECFFCQSTFAEPKVFCCTRLCKKCLQVYLDTAVLEEEVTCLVCNGSVPVPDMTQPRESWAEQFRTDLFLQRLKEVSLQLTQEHLCFVCGTSKNKEPSSSTVYCFDCDSYYCDSCNVMHLQLRDLMSHSTISLSELRPRDLQWRRPSFCDHHKDRWVEHFCRDCSRLLCEICREESHQSCAVIPKEQIAADKRRVLKDLKEKVHKAIERVEEQADQLSHQESRMTRRREEIETAFSSLESAVDERKKRLLAEVTGSCQQDDTKSTSNRSQLHKLLQALKDTAALAEEMIVLGSDRDLIESADDLVKECLALSERTHNAARFSDDHHKDMTRVDEYSVKTFLMLLNTLGGDIDELVVAFKTRQIDLVMSEDHERPAIKDMVLMDDNILLAVDSANKCLKAIIPRRGGGHKVLRLDLKTKLRGLASLQPAVVAVSGHQCLHIVTVGNQALSLQTTVRTRKDYCNITALSSNSIAGSCLNPPSIDIIDITGRRLRTIEGEQNGVVIFKQPSFLTSMNGSLLVMDQEERMLVCMDQNGEMKFRRQVGSSQEEEQWQVRGLCADQNNRIYLMDRSSVALLSSEGKQLCPLLACLPNARAISVGKGNLMAISMEGWSVTFFTLSQLKGPYL